MTARVKVLAIALEAVVLGSSAAPAQAATVSVAPAFGLQTLNYRAAPGEANRLTVTPAAGAVALSDPVGITTGGGCTRPVPAGTTRAVCSLPRFLTSLPLDATLGDGDDVVTAQLPEVIDVAEISGGRATT